MKIDELEDQKTMPLIFVMLDDKELQINIREDFNDVCMKNPDVSKELHEFFKKMSKNLKPRVILQ